MSVLCNQAAQSSISCMYLLCITTVHEIQSVNVSVVYSHGVWNSVDKCVSVAYNYGVRNLINLCHEIQSINLCLLCVTTVCDIQSISVSVVWNYGM